MNSERFLAMLHDIEQHLRKVSGRTDRGAHTFAAALHEAAQRRSEVRPFKDDLLEFAELRNAIVHHRTRPEYTIAEPHDAVVERLERIRAVVFNPPKVLPAFQQEVMFLQAEDPIAKPLSLMRTSDISQFPTYRAGQLMGLLSERCIARWLAHSTEVGLVIFDETPVSEVLGYEETGGRNYELVGRDENVFGARERFSRGPQQNLPVLDALLITHSGQPGEALLGIITTWDILNLRGTKEIGA